MATRHALRIALGLNAAMMIIDWVVGVRVHSAGLLADGLDMASDAGVYAASLLALSRGATFKRRVAWASGLALLILGVGLLAEVARRASHGVEPVAMPILAAATLSLAVNLYVLRLLKPFRSGDVHLRAAWIFTRADVLASLAVLLSAGLIAWSHSRTPDLVVGAAIAAYVIKEAIEILNDARLSRGTSDPHKGGVT